MLRSADPEYPDPRKVPGAFQLVIVVSIVVTGVLFATGSSYGLVSALPIAYYVVVIVRQGRRLRDEALAALEENAPAMPADELERRIEAVLKMYGGRVFPSVRERVERIRARARGAETRPAS